MIRSSCRVTAREMETQLKRELIIYIYFRSQEAKIDITVCVKYDCLTYPLAKRRGSEGLSWQVSWCLLLEDQLDGWWNQCPHWTKCWSLHPNCKVQTRCRKRKHKYKNKNWTNNLKKYILTLLHPLCHLTLLSCEDFWLDCLNAVTLLDTSAPKQKFSFNV